MEVAKRVAMCTLSLREHTVPDNMLGHFESPGPRLEHIILSFLSAPFLHNNDSTGIVAIICINGPLTINSRLLHSAENKHYRIKFIVHTYAFS